MNHRGIWSGDQGLQLQIIGQSSRDQKLAPLLEKRSQANVETGDVSSTNKLKGASSAAFYDLCS